MHEAQGLVTAPSGNTYFDALAAPEHAAGVDNMVSSTY